MNRKLIGRFGKAGKLDKLLVGVLLGQIELNSGKHLLRCCFGFSGGLGSSTFGAGSLGPLATGVGAGGSSFCR